jgi:hypothetical protein
MKVKLRAALVILALSIPASLAFEAEARNGQAAAPSQYPVVQGKVYKFEKIADGMYYATGGVVTTRSSLMTTM